MNTKNIVFVINDLKGNGAERVILTLADGMLQRGHTCHIICFKDLQEITSRHNIKTSIFPMQWFRWIPRKHRGKLVAPFLDAFIKNKAGNPDLVLSNLLPVDRILAHSRLPNTHLIVHNTLSLEYNLNGKNSSNKHWDELLHIYSRKPLVSVSDGVKQDAESVLAPLQHASKRIYNPVDVDFIFNSAKGEIPPSLKKEGYLIHVGKFKAAKRHDRLIRAYYKSNVEIPLLLLGQGPLEQENKALVKELNLEDKVLFSGFQPNPYPFIRAAKGMVLSSDFEGLGMVILEAITLDVPVISTDCPSGPSEILPANNLVDVDDEAQLAKKMAALVQSSESFKIPLSDEFLVDIAVDEYLSLIEEA